MPLTFLFISYQEFLARDNAVKSTAVCNTVLYNLRCLHHSSSSSPASLTPPAAYEHYGAEYFRKSPTSSDVQQNRLDTGTGAGGEEEEAELGSGWLHSASVPLLCLDINDLSSLLLPPPPEGLGK